MATLLTVHVDVKQLPKPVNLLIVPRHTPFQLPEPPDKLVQLRIAQAIHIVKAYPVVDTRMIHRRGRG
jgi:hypothetical protein